MKTVVAMFENRADAEDAIRRLQAAGFHDENIGVAMRDHQDGSYLATTTGAHDMSAEGATAGMVSGGAVGTLVGIALIGSSLVLPGIGPLVIGGPIAAALTGAGIGAVSGGLLGALIGTGIPEDEASRYASGVEEGGILVSVQTNDANETRARQILLQEGARIS